MLHYDSIAFALLNVSVKQLRPYGSGVEHFLGKEEVVSSSLTMGSTTKNLSSMDINSTMVYYLCPYRLILT